MSDAKLPVRRRLTFGDRKVPPGSVEKEQLVTELSKWLQDIEQNLLRPADRLSRYRLSTDLDDTDLKEAIIPVRTLLSSFYETDFPQDLRDQSLKFARLLFRRPTFLAQPARLQAWFDKHLKTKIDVEYVAYWIWAGISIAFSSEGSGVPDDTEERILDFLEALISQRPQFEERLLSKEGKEDLQTHINNTLDAAVEERYRARVQDKWVEVQEGKNWPPEVLRYIANRPELASQAGFFQDLWNWWKKVFLEASNIDQVTEVLKQRWYDAAKDQPQGEERYEKAKEVILDWMNTNLGREESNEGMVTFTDALYQASIASTYSAILTHPSIQDALMTLPTVTLTLILSAGNIKNGSNWDQQIYQIYQITGVFPIMEMEVDKSKWLNTMLIDVANDRLTRPLQAFLKSIFDSIPIVPLVGTELPPNFRTAENNSIFPRVDEHQKRNVDPAWVTQVWNPIANGLLTQTEIGKWMAAILKLPESESRYFVRLFLRASQSATQGQALASLIGNSRVDEKQLAAILVPESKDVTGRRWITATATAWNQLDTKQAPDILTRGLWQEMIRDQIIKPNRPIQQRVETLTNRLHSWAKDIVLAQAPGILEVFHYHFFVEGGPLRDIMGALLYFLSNLLINGWSPLVLQYGLVLNIGHMVQQSGVKIRPKYNPPVIEILQKMFAYVKETAITPFEEIVPTEDGPQRTWESWETKFVSPKSKRNFEAELKQLLEATPPYVVKLALDVLHTYLDEVRTIIPASISKQMQTYVTSTNSQDMAWVELLGRPRSAMLDVPMDIDVVEHLFGDEKDTSPYEIMQSWYRRYTDYYYKTPRDAPEGILLLLGRLDPLLTCNVLYRQTSLEQVQSVAAGLALLSLVPNSTAQNSDLLANELTFSVFTRIQETRKDLEQLRLANERKAKEREVKEREWKQVVEDDKSCPLDTCAVLATKEELSPCAPACHDRASIWLKEWLNKQLPQEFQVSEGKTQYKASFTQYSLKVVGSIGKRTYFLIQSKQSGWWDSSSARGTSFFQWSLWPKLLTHDQLIHVLFTNILPQISAHDLQVQIECHFLQYVKRMPSTLFSASALSPTVPRSAGSREEEKLQIVITSPPQHPDIRSTTDKRVVWIPEYHFEPVLQLIISFPFTVRSEPTNARIGASLLYDSAICSNDTDTLSQRAPDEFLKATGVTFIFLPDPNINPAQKVITYCMGSQELMEYWTPEAKNDAPTGNYSWGFCRQNPTDKETEECDAFYQLPTHAGVFYVTPDTRNAVLQYLRVYQGGLKFELEPITSVIQGRKNPIGHRQSEAPNEWITIYQIRRLV